MTPHINAGKGDFAKTCLLPGDPLRAKFVAENFLTKVKQVNSVRNMFGYTGLYKGKEISVMGSGMGIPSISIYAKELITEYGVEQLIRVGSCGAIQKDLNLLDIVICSGASTDSLVNRTRFDGMDFAAIPDFKLTQELVEQAKKSGKNVKVGGMFSADLFYTPQTERFQLMEKMGVLAVEMEAAGLFGVALEYGAKAAAINTVSDHILNGGDLTPEQRETGFSEMIEIALEVGCTN